MKRVKEKRFLLIQVIFIVLFIIIAIRLFVLMINKGEYYKELSDNRKVQQVDEIASRGNILDRNGNILATTVPSFAVQLYKDQINSLSDDQRTKSINTLSNILEKAGVNYKNDFGIRLNSFEYEKEDDYFNEAKSPEDSVVDKIIDNDLVENIVSSYYSEGDSEYISLKTALLALKKRGIDIPLHVAIKDNKLSVTYKENADKKLETIGHSTEEDPIDVVVAAIDNDSSVIKNILENAEARRLVYKTLESKKLQGNVVLKDYALLADEQLIQKKANLSKIYKNITKDSSPADDFYEIVKNSSMSELLKTASVDDDGTYVIPADILIEKLENKGIYANFTTEVVTESENDENIYKVNVEFKNSQAGDPVEELARIAEENGLTKKFIQSEGVKYLAQNANTVNNIYPSIDVSEDKVKDWSYTFTKDKDDFLKYYANKDPVNSQASAIKTLKKTKDPKQILDYIKTVEEIDNENDYEAIGMLTIDSKINQQGNYGFRPINLVYNLDENTVLQIEEALNSSTGIVVDSIPIRSYPNRELASHILGYMGPIATNDEVNKFINEKDYLNDEIIGKTGIEESYQDNLRGKNGKSIVTVDSSGNRVNTISTEASEPGDDVYLSIDMSLQERAEKSLKGVIESLSEGTSYESEYGTFTAPKGAPNASSGAVVVSDVKTGEVLAMASYPNYDPNLFATGISSSDWDSLQVSDDSSVLAARPMMNIASQTAVMPGSTFKLVSSLAALEKGLDPQKTSTDYGYIEIGNSTFNNLRWTEEGTTWGEENLYDAIMHSSNYYIYTLALGENPRDGSSLGVKLELNDIREAALKLGLGEKTGIEINIPNETTGNIPSVGKKLEVTKAMLEKYLKSDLKLYIKKNTKKTNSEIENDISEIVKLADDPTKYDRDTLIAFLDNLGYEPETILEDKSAGLADTIKYTYLNQASWDITDMLNIVIGQGQNSYTPLQMNRVMATVANGGYLNKYTLIDKINKHETKDVLFQNETESKQVDVSDSTYFDDIRYGTLLVAQSNEVLSTLPINIGLKTGTAEVEGKNEDGSDYEPYAWMVAFAPYEDPQIAISVVLTQGNTSYNVSPIVRDIIAQYFDLTVSNKTQTNTQTDTEDDGQTEDTTTTDGTETDDVEQDDVPQDVNN